MPNRAAPLWQHRLGGNFAASPWRRMASYFTSREGLTTVLRPGHEYRELASNQLLGKQLLRRLGGLRRSLAHSGRPRVVLRRQASVLTGTINSRRVRRGAESLL